MQSANKPEHRMRGGFQWGGLGKGGRWVEHRKEGGISLGEKKMDHGRILEGHRGKGRGGKKNKKKKKST